MKETLKAIRAVRSLEYNRALKPKVEARSRLKAYLMLNAATSIRLGNYQAELVDGDPVVTKLPPDGWEQVELQGLGAGQALPERSSYLVGRERTTSADLASPTSYRTAYTLCMHALLPRLDLQRFVKRNPG